MEIYIIEKKMFKLVINKTASSNQVEPLTLIISKVLLFLAQAYPILQKQPFMIIRIPTPFAYEVAKIGAEVITNIVRTGARSGRVYLETEAKKLDKGKLIMMEQPDKDRWSSLKKNSYES